MCFCITRRLWKRKVWWKLCFLIKSSRRAHTVTVLIVMLCVLVYVGAFEQAHSDGEYNTKRWGSFTRRLKYTVQFFQSDVSVEGLLLYNRPPIFNQFVLRRAWSPGHKTSQATIISYCNCYFSVVLFCHFCRWSWFSMSTKFVWKMVGIHCCSCKSFLLEKVGYLFVVVKHSN